MILLAPYNKQKAYFFYKYILLYDFAYPLQQTRSFFSSYKCILLHDFACPQQQTKGPPLYSFPPRCLSGPESMAAPSSGGTLLTDGIVAKGPLGGNH